MAFIENIKATFQKPKDTSSSNLWSAPASLIADIRMLSTPFSIHFEDSAFVDGLDGGVIDKAQEETTGSPISLGPKMQYNSSFIDGLFDDTENETKASSVNSSPQSTFRKLSMSQHDDDQHDELSFVPKQNILDDITSVFKVGTFHLNAKSDRQITLCHVD